MQGLKIFRRTTGIVIGRDGGTTDKLTAIKEYLGETLELFRQYTSKFNHRTKCKEKIHAADWWYESTANGYLSFHYNLKDNVAGIDGIDKFVVNHEPAIGSPCSFDLRPTVKYRDGQENYVNFLVNHNSHVRILPATMGAGKTASTIMALSKIKRKALIIVPPSIKDEWMDSIVKFTTLPQDKFIYIQGGVNMEALYDLVVAGEEIPFDITVIGINTLQNFINSFKGQERDFSLMEFFDLSGWGVRVVDEAHKFQHFHSMCSSMMNFNVNIFLTATLMKEYEFEAKMEGAVYPLKDRCPVPEASNHVELIAYKYDWAEWMPGFDGPMGYMHSKYEKYIRESKLTLKSYLDMLDSILHRDFITKWEKGDRALVYFASVELVAAFTKLVTEKYPDMVVVNYKAGEPKSVLMEADIIVATVKKAGTGTDIPQLRYVLQTIPISAKGENFQNVGRLRNLKGLTTIFAYIWTPKVEKQVRYHVKRQEELKPLIHASHRITYPILLKCRKFTRK